MKYFAVLPALAISLFNLPAHALDGREVMNKTLNAYYYQGHDLRARAHMRIVDKQGRERIRELTLLRRNLDDANGKQKYYVYFSKPADVKKMVFMAWKNIDRSDDRWLYLPALDLVRRIAASDERTSFVGSHFFYEDVSGRGLDEDDHQLIDENKQRYIVQSTPKQPKTVEFAHYQVHVDKHTALPMRIDYVDDNNNIVYRSYQTLDIAEIDGYPTVIKAQMSDHRTEGVTVIEYSAIEYAQDIPETLFSERYLRRAPKKYLD